MAESNYWSRLAERRLSRRRILGGAVGIAAGGAALSLVGCGGGSKKESGVSGTTPAAGSTPTGIGRNLRDAPAEVQTRGGVIRDYGYEPLSLDTLDPHQTQFGPVYDIHASVLSKVLKYDDVYEGVISTDLAASMPETPDNLTYVIKLRPNITFHDSDAIRSFASGVGAASVPGRQLTADDIKYSIERQTNTSSPKYGLYYRSGQWETIDKIEIVDPLTLRITTKAPTAPFVHYLADSNSFIIARELVDQASDSLVPAPQNDPHRLIGTGPFMVDKYVALQISRGIRNPNWHAADDNPEGIGKGRPFIDAYEVLWTTQDPTALEAAFRDKQVDSFATEDGSVVQHLADSLGLPVRVAPSSGFIYFRFLCNDSPAAKTPLKDVRLRQAISLALDRNQMNQQMLRGSGYLPGPVAQAIRRWALSPADLAKKPGYRFTQPERQDDLANAKQLWDAAGGSAVGTISIVHAGSPNYIPQVMPQVQKMLKDVLGLDTSLDPDATGYTKLAQGLLEKSIVIGMGYDNGWNDVDDWVYPYFHSSGAKNSFNFSDPDLDRMLEAERQEFDVAARQQKGYDIQNYLVDKVAARLELVSPASPSTHWSYLKNTVGVPWYGNAFHRADVWVDTSDGTYQGRKA